MRARRNALWCLDQSVVANAIVHAECIISRLREEGEEKKERCSHGIHYDSVICYPNAEVLTACSIQTAYRGTKCGRHFWPIEADDEHSQLLPLAQTQHKA